MEWFLRRNASIQDVFHCLGLCVTGQRLLKKARALPVEWVEIPPSLKALWLDSLPMGWPLGAAYVTDGLSHRVFYDPEAELAILVPFLAHELSHRCDFWTQVALFFPKRMRAWILIQSEFKAYAIQSQIIQELVQIFPKLKVYYLEKYPEVACLHRTLEKREIRKRYGKKSQVDR